MKFKYQSTMYNFSGPSEEECVVTFYVDDETGKLEALIQSNYRVMETYVLEGYRPSRTTALHLLGLYMKGRKRKGA